VCARRALTGDAVLGDAHVGDLDPARGASEEREARVDRDRDVEDAADLVPEDAHAREAAVANGGSRRRLAAEDRDALETPVDLVTDDVHVLDHVVGGTTRCPGDAPA
jgi:hypothetical protein